MTDLNNSSREKALIKDHRPLVTLVLFTYNQERYVTDAVLAAFSQTYTPLEIILSDDCSSDNTFDLIEKLFENYRGPHKVLINRNSKNLGLIGHVNKSFTMASGQLIVAAAGDDISLPERVGRIVDKYDESGQTALLIHSNAIAINEYNIGNEILIPPFTSSTPDVNKLGNSDMIYIGATGAWNRILYEKFGPILFKEAYEDLVFGFRAGLVGSILYISQPLIKYRVNVGISSTPDTVSTKFRRRINNRKKAITTRLDVLRQRLMDVELCDQNGNFDQLKVSLDKAILFESNRKYLYSNPIHLIMRIKYKNFPAVCMMIVREIKYVLGFYD